MKQAKPILHGADHGPGGPDPIGGGGGIAFDTDPQTGHWLLISTTSTEDGTSGGYAQIQRASLGYIARVTDGANLYDEVNRGSYSSVITSPIGTGNGGWSMIISGGGQSAHRNQGWDLDVRDDFNQGINFALSGDDNAGWGVGVGGDRNQGINLALSGDSNGGIQLRQNGTNDPGIILQAAGDGPISIRTSTFFGHGNGGIDIDDPGTGGVNVQKTSTGKLGFFGVTPVVQQAAPTTVGDIATALHNLGLTA